MNATDPEMAESRAAPDVFRLDPDKPAKWLFAGVLTLVVGAALIFAQIEGRAAWAGVGSLLVLFGVWNWQASRNAARARADRAPKLIIDPDGLTIPELFGRTVPWAAITRLDPAYGERGDMLAFHVTEPARFDCRRRAWIERDDVSSTFNCEALDGDSRAIRAALLRHAPRRLTNDF
jgi:hypothetical protein